MKDIIKLGLNDDEVKERQDKNLVNYDTSVPTKSIKKIFFDNFFNYLTFLRYRFLSLKEFYIYIILQILNFATKNQIFSKKLFDKIRL